MTQQPEEAGFWLSPQQERIWNAGGNSVAFVGLDTPPNHESLLHAVRELVRIHEPLRTVYRRMAGMKLPFQVVLPACEPSWEERPFNLEHGPVLQVSAVEGGVKITVPAVVADVPSMRILGEQLRTLLRGGQLEASEIRYVQFAQWQRDLIDDEDSKEGRSFWASVTVATTPLLPGERGVPGEYRSGSIRFELPVAPVPTLLAAWQSLIWRLSGQTEFPIDVFVPQREYEELRGAVGLIGKQLHTRAHFEPDSRFRSIAEQATQSLDLAAKWSDSFPGGEAPDAISFDWADSKLDEGITNSGKLRLSVRPDGALLQYNSAVLDENIVGRWVDYYRRLLEGAIANPEAPVSSLPLIGKEEQEQFAKWNDTASEYPRTSCFHELFEKQVEETPDLPALRCGDRELTYRELNTRANRLAHHLRALGIGPDARVAASLPRGVDSIVALLGIIKAGGACVSLNADHPPALLDQQLQGTAALLTQEEFVGLPWQDQPGTNLTPLAGPENLIYVIYTSGSTGIPKGVGVRHRNLVNYAWHIRNRLPGTQMHWATVSTLSADLGNTCIYPALISGGCLHVIPQDVASDASSMGAYVKQHPIDVLKIVPSHLSALLETAEGRDVLPTKSLILGGEALSHQLVSRLRDLNASCEVWNHYGPTETTVGSLMLRLDDYAGEQIPIGKPIANTQVYILNEQQQPAPIGTAGELYIGGDGVTAGYLGQPELTAERFAQGRYRTGDLARFLPDGNVEFLGRADDQIKIRGFRIELGEIETALVRHPSVKHAVVIAREDGMGGKQLVAYIVARSTAIDTGELRAYLKTQVPEYMVPNDIVPLPRIPLTPNGKVDRKALPTPEAARLSEREYIAPATASEEAVAGIWAATMRRDRIGVDDDFFEIGGHSLLATQIASRLREHFRMPVAVRMIFEYPTIRLLAAELALRPSEEEDDFEIVPAGRMSN